VTSVKAAESSNFVGVCGINVINVETVKMPSLKYLESSSVICIPKIGINIFFPLIVFQFASEISVGIKSVGNGLDPFQAFGKRIMEF
jgi:hypothetical protein